MCGELKVAENVDESHERIKILRGGAEKIIPKEQ
jgi:hypothetical protein